MLDALMTGRALTATGARPGRRRQPRHGQRAPREAARGRARRGRLAGAAPVPPARLARGRRRARVAVAHRPGEAGDHAAAVEPRPVAGRGTHLLRPRRRAQRGRPARRAARARLAGAGAGWLRALRARRRGAARLGRRRHDRARLAPSASPGRAWTGPSVASTSRARSRRRSPTALIDGPEPWFVRRSDDHRGLRPTDLGRDAARRAGLGAGRAVGLTAAPPCSPACAAWWRTHSPYPRAKTEGTARTASKDQSTKETPSGRWPSSVRDCAMTAQTNAVSAAVASTSARPRNAIVIVGSGGRGARLVPRSMVGIRAGRQATTAVGRDRAVHVRVRRVADRLLADLGVEQVALDLQDQQRLGHIGVVPVPHGGYLVVVRRVDEALLLERAPVRRRRVRPGVLRLLPVGQRRDVEDPHAGHPAPRTAQAATPTGRSRRAVRRSRTR